MCASVALWGYSLHSTEYSTATTIHKDVTPVSHSLLIYISLYFISIYISLYFI